MDGDAIYEGHDQTRHRWQRHGAGFPDLLQRGYSVCQDALGSPGQKPLWHAEREGIHLVAEEPLSLLALAVIVESRGAEWCATAEQIESFLREYGENPPA